MISRRVTENITSKQLNQGKVVIVYGARQTGKTTLLSDLKSRLNCKTLSLNCDLASDQASLTTDSVQAQASVWKDYELILIDEAQRKRDIGLVLKIAVDHFPDKNFVVTGSSSLDLSNQVSEPLTGRTLTNILYPLSFAELADYQNIPQVTSGLSQLLRFGAYPEIYTTASTTEKESLLGSLASDYLFKDVLEYQDIRKPDLLIKLLKLLAYQLGNEVSFHELSTRLGINQQTVYNYIDLLEKAFVVFRLTPYSSNLRKEINTKEKIFFYDLGIRNALIGDFNEIELRNDRGALWENFVVIERMKKRQYDTIAAQQFFWRTYDQAEVDFVEQRAGKLYGYEIKYSSSKKAKPPKAWTSAYPDAQWSVVNRDNFVDFLL